MSTTLERPAGRPASGARPAGAPDIIRVTRRPRIGRAPQHGERERYRQHILEGSEPCALCREAERVEKAAYRARRYLAGGQLLVDATGTRRRIEALAAVGWSAAELADRLGCDHTNVSKWAKQTRVQVRTRDIVAQLYDALSMTPGPSSKIRRIALSKGWAPPLAWDDESIDDPAARPHRTGDRHAAGAAFDEIAVYRAMHGDQVRLRPVERAEVVRRLTAQRLSAAEIAARLDTTIRSVVRHRTADPTRRTA